MFTFNPKDHRPSLCAECGTDLPTDVPPPVVTVELDGEHYRVGGLFRCAACQAFIEAGAIRSNVDLKAAHDFLREQALPKMMIVLTETENDIKVIGLKGSGIELDDMMEVSRLVQFAMRISGEFDAAGDLCELLDTHFGIASDEFISTRMQDLLRESTEAEVNSLTAAELDELVTSLDLKRENGVVTYLCPNPVCPSEDTRHPLAMAEPIFSDRLVAALVGRIPE